MVRNPNPLVIIVVRKDILLMCAGARMQISMTNLRTWDTVISAKIKFIRHMNARLKPSGHQDLKVTTTTIRSMDIGSLSVDPSLNGHQISRQRLKKQWKLL